MIDEKAQELGRLIGQASEYQALRRAEQSLRDDPEAQKRLETISRLTREFDELVAAGADAGRCRRAAIRDDAARVRALAGRARATSWRAPTSTS